MIVVLLLEMALASLLAAILGHVLGKFKGARNLGGLTLLANVLTLAFASPIMLQPRSLDRPESAILELAIWTYVMVGFLGFLLSETFGSVIVLGSTTAAVLVCFYLTVLPGAVQEWLAVVGLLVAIALVGTIGVRIFSQKVLRGKGARPLAVFWFGFCATGLIGYWAAGRVGTFLITLPTLLVFWGFLYYISGRVLPLQDDQRAQQENHRLQAFRSLLTFALGTNYPYYVIEDWKTRENADQDKPAPRVPGNPFNRFLAGPGIVICSADHAAVTSTGFRLKVAPPGLSFTGKYEDLYAPVDLRTQLRARKIEAETKDGIVVRILTFMPHRIGAGGRQPALGKSYPYNKEDVSKAVFDKTLVEHKWARDQEELATEDISKTPWDELVVAMGPPILKKIISGYTCNELHAPGDPRVEIVRKFREQLSAAMAPLGIEMVGGGISNIDPPDEVVEQRIKNWEADWKRRIEVELGEKEAAITREQEAVWAQAQLQMMDTLTRMLERGAVELTEEALVFQLIEALTSVPPATDDSQLERYLISRPR